MDAWLTTARDALAAEAGIPRAELELSEDDADALLKVARIAAHVSDDRRNAPLLCYLLGRAQGTRDVASLAEAVRRSTS